MLLLLLTLISLNVCNGFRILAVFPTPVPSHAILGYGIVKHLLDAGHQVTYITAIPKENPHDNLTQIDVFEQTKIYPRKFFHLEEFMDNPVDDVKHIAFHKSVDMSEYVLKCDDVQKIMNDPKEKFDIIILEWIFVETYMGLGVVFDCPIIWFLPSEPHWLALKVINSQHNLEYVRTDVTVASSFLRSSRDQIKDMKYKMFMKIINNDKQSKMYEDIYTPVMSKKRRDLPPYKDVYLNFSLVFSNYEMTLSQKKVFPYTLKFIGGYHIKTHEEDAPTYLLRLMDLAKYGFIYFSMGSNLESYHLPRRVQKALLILFGKLEQTVFWKFENELSFRIPKNVHILKWAPQQKILGHPNCLLFITHGGVLSLIESVYYGVPIIGIPVYGDQTRNVFKACQLGCGLEVELSYNLATDLENAIYTILNNPAYRMMVSDLSIEFKSHAVAPGIELVEWVEHTIKRRGRPERPTYPQVLRPWYHNMNMEIITFIVFVVYLFQRALRCIPCYSRNNKIK